MNVQGELGGGVSKMLKFYRTNSMYWDRYVSANSADQDQTASEEAV